MSCIILHTELGPPASKRMRLEDRLNSSWHHTSLLKQLHNHATHWRDIGTKLGFVRGELDNIESNAVLTTRGPRSYLDTLLAQWLEWAPGDGRGSQGFATLEGLRDALRQANLGAIAHDLHL